MLSNLRRRLTFANVMSTIAVFVALGGGAYAAAKVDSGDIEDDSVRSKDIKDDKLKGKDVKTDKLRGDDIDESTLVGVKAGNVLSAVVSNPAGASNATVVRAGQEGTTVTEGPGNAVLVDFGGDVTQCAWVATRGAPETGTEDPGFAQTALGNTNNRVEVRTRDEAGTPEDGNFHLVVVC
ncbi:MAG TPA: hypothetical protein VE401_02955 [Solirubrobacterales bacterium]|nr:hypothetical protein [Solirubrobacterales bacterium]